jgi:single-stranded-DNA-specific exonuclease
MRRFLMSALGLAAVGTVCDVVPLVDENRVIVRHGLINLKQTDIEGLRELIRLSELDSKPVLSAEDIGFRIGPRLNASGRLGQAQLGVELLTSSSRSRVNALAEYINNLNSSRDSIERRITKAANKQIKESFDPACEPALVLAEPDWHKGVIGIVAGRIAERYHRPTIVISIDPLRNQLAVGSGRSALGIDLYQALADCSELLESFGGHRAAAGLKIDPQHIEPFRERFYQAILSQANVVEMVPELQIDVETSLCQMTMDTIREIEKLAPFGQENPRPLLCASEVQLAAPPKRMGEGGRHLSLKLTQHDVRINAVAFGHGDWAEELEQSESGCFDFAFRPSINEFRGRRSVQLLIADWRESSLDRIDSTNGIPRSNPAATFDSAKT